LFLQFGDLGLTGGDGGGRARDFAGQAVFEMGPAFRAEGAANGYRVGQIAFADFAPGAVADVFAQQVIAGDFGNALFPGAVRGFGSFSPGFRPPGALRACRRTDGTRRGWRNQAVQLELIVVLVALFQQARKPPAFGRR
jgi:hypothetical protein